MKIFFIKEITVCIVLIIILTSCAKPSEPSIFDEALSIEFLFPTGGYARDISVSDSLLFIAEDQQGFSIYNYLTRTQICHFDTLFIFNPVPFENVRKISVVENEVFLFVYDRYGSPPSINIFDITDISEPDCVFRIQSNTGNIEDMYSHTNSGGGVTLNWTNNGVNSNSINFRESNDNWEEGIEYSFPNSISGFDMNEEYIVIAAQQYGFHIVDKNSGEVLSTTDTPGEALDVKIVDNYVCLAIREAGLAIFDISNVSNPEMVYIKDIGELIYTIDAENDYLVLSSHAGGIYFFDISDIENPGYLGKVDKDNIGYTYKAVFKNGKVFAATRQGVYILDIND
ncbi:MAG: hypothetical protein KAU01_08595 [Candidatus Cloacimonetes bacterium]|nr:hypothetical protein [Candidatus Cloacimonadota bacterium]